MRLRIIVVINNDKITTISKNMVIRLNDIPKNERTAFSPAGTNLRSHRLKPEQTEVGRRVEQPGHEEFGMRLLGGSGDFF